MEEDRPASPEQHLWSSILDSVSSSRAIPSKNVIILGEPSSGKSTIANALLQKSSVDKQRELATKQGDRSAYDFAVGYEWADVKDEAEEGRQSSRGSQTTLTPEITLSRYTGTPFCVFGPFLKSGPSCSIASLCPTKIRSAALGGRHRPRLDAPMDVCRTALHLARLG